MQNIVGRRVREARLSHKPPFTQEELAAEVKRLGFSINRIGIAKIEGGIRQVRDYEVVKLASALNVSVNWLLGED